MTFALRLIGSCLAGFCFWMLIDAIQAAPKHILFAVDGRTIYGVLSAVAAVLMVRLNPFGRFP